VVMEAGRIVERGTHDELMRARGVYFEMVTRQREAMAAVEEGVWPAPAGDRRGRGAS